MTETREFVGYKRWRLHGAVTPEQVADFVRERIEPAYAALSAEVSLGLEESDDGTMVALQRWTSREARERAMSGPGFEGWWEAYVPVLEEWDRLVEFVDEWETQVWI